MGKKILFYSAGLIALYLIVVNAEGFARDVTATAQGATSVTKGFQGR